MALFQPIGGTLPFGGGRAPTDYGSAYQQALGQNKATYGNVLQGYQQVLANQQAGQAQVLKGYRNLQSAAMADLEGVGTERGLQIGEQAARDRGAILNRLVGSGLGNSTMLANFTMAANRDEARARNDLAERIAQQRLGVRLQTGLAAQGYRADANQQNINTGLAQLGFMNSTMAPYPDPSLYSQLAAQSAKVEMNPYKVALAAGGGAPQASPGLMPSTGSGRPVGGYGPTSPAFYAGGGGFDAGPQSGASLQQTYNIPATSGYGGAMNTGYYAGPTNASFSFPAWAAMNQIQGYQSGDWANTGG